MNHKRLDDTRVDDLNDLYSFEFLRKGTKGWLENIYPFQQPGYLQLELSDMSNTYKRRHMGFKDFPGLMFGNDEEALPISERTCSVSVKNVGNFLPWNNKVFV